MFAMNEPLILTIDLGITSGIAVGRRLRTHDNRRWRYDLYWDGTAHPEQIYGVLEQLLDEYSINIVIVEQPILSITNPYYKQLTGLVEDLGDYRHIFGNIPVFSVMPAQWKTTPAIKFKPADNQQRTTHQWDAIRIGYWFAQYGAKAYYEKTEKES